MIDTEEPEETKGKPGESFWFRRSCVFVSGKDVWGPQGDGFVKTKPGDFRITAMKIKCPGECLKKTANKMPLIGPAMPENDKDIFSAFKYTLDTSICAAAIHSSIISEQQGGMVI